MYGLAGATLLTITTEAFAFDLDAAGRALTVPIRKFIDDFWPVAVLAVGCGGAVVTPGDLRTKAYGFGAGTLLAGVMMIAVKMGLGL